MDNRPIVFCGASGSGKSTIINHILKSTNIYRFSISHTTRKMRVNEVNGVEYHFISKDEFIKKINQNEFFEYEYFNNNYYGTSRNELERNEKVVIFDLGIEGVKSFKESKIDARFICIKITEKSELIARIKNRSGKELDYEDLNGRIANFENFNNFIENNCWDCELVNLSLDDSIKKIDDFLKINQ